MQLSRPSAAGSAGNWDGETVVLSAGVCTVRGSLLPSKGDAGRCQQTVLTSLELMSKRSIGSSLRACRYKSLNPQPYQRRSMENQCLLGWEMGSPVMAKAGSL